MVLVWSLFFLQILVKKSSLIENVYVKPEIRNRELFLNKIIVETILCSLFSQNCSTGAYKMILRVIGLFKITRRDITWKIGISTYLSVGFFSNSRE